MFVPPIFPYGISPRSTKGLKTRHILARNKLIQIVLNDYYWLAQKTILADELANCP
jgi:hypothetical protein